MTKSIELDSPYITHNETDGRCICKDSAAILSISTEESFAYIKDCTNNFIMGDINNDNEVNVIDVILIVNLTLENEFNESADLNSDNTIDILDVVQLVNIILQTENN